MQAQSDGFQEAGAEFSLLGLQDCVGEGYWRGLFVKSRRTAGPIGEILPMTHVAIRQSLTGSRSVHQELDAIRHFLYDPQQRRDKLLVDIHLALVLGEIPLPVRLVEDSPLFGRKIDRMLQALEHQITRLGAVTLETQRRQRQSMPGVVGEVEAALETQVLVRGIDKTTGA